MKRWAIVTIVLYAITLLAAVVPITLAAFWEKCWAGEPNFLGGVYTFVPLYVWLGVMVVAQVAFLALPVRLAQTRPVTKIWIFWPMLAGGVMFVVLAVAMGFVVFETVVRLWGDRAWTEEYSLPSWAMMAAVVAFWILWSIAFGFYTGRSEPKGLIQRIVRWLIAGSIVELLVAIPAHVYARMKDDCCGGILTVWGLAAGIAVMLFAFGPGVFILFTRRLKSIRPSRPNGESSNTLPR
jgi:hypothetical protein